MSTIFSPYFDKDILKTGSLGLSFTVDEGVASSLEEVDEPRTFFNNQEITIASVDYVRTHLAPHPILISFQSKLRIGTGFGVSAACALSAAFSINRYFDLGKKEEELLQVAHAADAVSRTGLSDVITQYTGGVIVRYKKYHPFMVKTIEGFNEQSIYAHILDKLDTKTVLEDSILISKIKNIGESLVKTIEKKGIHSIEDLLRYSYVFSQESTLIEKASLQSILQEINNKKIQASMIMLGRSFFSSNPIHGFSLQHMKISNERTRYV